jgi:hypothetical protein
MFGTKDRKSFNQSRRPFCEGYEGGLGREKGPLLTKMMPAIAA